MVTNPNLTPQKRLLLKKRAKRPKGNANSQDFYRVAAALANPDFTDLPSADRQTIRQTLTKRSDNKSFS